MIESAADNPLAACLKKGKKENRLTLPKALPGDSADKLAEVILGVRNGTLAIDAGAVERIDTPCIQVLLAASKTWKEDGAAMRFDARSENFNANAETLGLTGTELVDLGDANHA